MSTITPTSLSRPTADLLSGGLGLPASVSDGDWVTFCESCEARLLAALCRSDNVKPDSDDYTSWLSLLANWCKAVYAANQSGIRPTTAKSMRNFSVSYGADGAVDLKNFYRNFSDLIAKFSECGSGVAMQSDWTSVVYAPESVQPQNLLQDAPPLYGGSL